MAIKPVLVCLDFMLNNLNSITSQGKHLFSFQGTLPGSRAYQAVTSRYLTEVSSLESAW